MRNYYELRDKAIFHGFPDAFCEYWVEVFMDCYSEEDRNDELLIKFLDNKLQLRGGC